MPFAAIFFVMVPIFCSLWSKKMTKVSTKIIFFGVRMQKNASERQKNVDTDRFLEKNRNKTLVFIIFLITSCQKIWFKSVLMSTFLCCAIKSYRISRKKRTRSVHKKEFALQLHHSPSLKLRRMLTLVFSHDGCCSRHVYIKITLLHNVIPNVAMLYDRSDAMHYTSNDVVWSQRCDALHI
jgi:hypothetical protein